MSNSIIDVLNQSIQNFRMTRTRNKSRPSPAPRSRDSSVQKLNSSYESEKSYPKPFSSSHQKPIQVIQLDSSSSSKAGKDSFRKILDSDSFVETKSPVKQKARDLDETEDMQELFKEIEQLKSDQKNLETQVEILENKICENLRDMHEPLKQAEFNDIISRITGLQGKFASRSKSSFPTENLTDLFDKIFKLEAEADNIRRENSEIESMYQQSLNEVYQKIEKLKSENKALTNIILSNNGSPKGPKKYVQSSTDSLVRVESERFSEKIELFCREKDELENERMRLEKELSEIPSSSKSMASKKKRQTLEKELSEVMFKLGSLNSKSSL